MNKLPLLLILSLLFPSSRQSELYEEYSTNAQEYLTVCKRARTAIEKDYVDLADLEFADETIFDSLSEPSESTSSKLKVKPINEAKNTLHAALLEKFNAQTGLKYKNIPFAMVETSNWPQNVPFTAPNAWNISHLNALKEALPNIHFRLLSHLKKSSKPNDVETSKELHGRLVEALRHVGFVKANNTIDWDRLAQKYSGFLITSPYPAQWSNFDCEVIEAVINDLDPPTSYTSSVSSLVDISTLKTTSKPTSSPKPASKPRTKVQKISNNSKTKVQKASTTTKPKVQRATTIPKITPKTAQRQESNSQNPHYQRAFKLKRELLNRFNAQNGTNYRNIPFSCLEISNWPPGVPFFTGNNWSRLNMNAIEDSLNEILLKHIKPSKKRERPDLGYKKILHERLIEALNSVGFVNSQGVIDWYRLAEEVDGFPINQPNPAQWSEKECNFVEGIISHFSD